MAPVKLLFFDRYNVGDPLFVADVARRLAAAARNGSRAFVVHASDDAIERVTETYAPAAEPEQTTELIERAVRLTNQSVTRRMIDEGVSAVSIQGSDKGLLRLGRDDSISTGSSEWLERAISLGGVPVVSLLARTEEGRSVPVSAASVLGRLTGSLSNAWSVTIVFFTTNRKSALFDSDGLRLESVSRAELSSFAQLPDIVRTGELTGKATLIVTNSAGLNDDGTVSGTRIV